MHVTPWQITGRKPGMWKRYVWRKRMELYISELNAKQQRVIDEARNG